MANRRTSKPARRFDAFAEKVTRHKKRAYAVAAGGTSMALLALLGTMLAYTYSLNEVCQQQLSDFGAKNCDGQPSNWQDYCANHGRAYLDFHCTSSHGTSLSYDAFSTAMQARIHDKQHSLLLDKGYVWGFIAEAIVCVLSAALASLAACYGCCKKKHHNDLHEGLLDEDSEHTNLSL